MYREFIVKECLTAKQLKSLDSVFRLNGQSSDEVRLLRLLTGTSDLELTRTGQVHRVRTSLLEFPAIIKEDARAGSFLTCLSPDCSRSQLAAYYRKTRQSNTNLFRPLVAEYCHYHSGTAAGNHTRAFMHVYRMLELISYMFPLIFASRAGSYFGTYTQLKSFFGEKKEGGELSFFKKFVEDTMGPGFSVSLRFNGVNADVNRAYVRVVESAMNDDDILTVTYPNEIEFSVQALVGLVIEVRNRWFHMAIGGRRNLSTFDMPESDDFFAELNQLAMNWIALIYREVLKTSVQART